MANNIKIENEQVVGQTYSTSEKWTGDYWIDGKKIYRRVFQGNSGSLHTGLQAFHITTSVNPSSATLINIRGFIDIYSIPWMYTGSGTVENTIWFDFYQGIRFLAYIGDAGSASGLSNKTITVIVEYTKTTED